MQYIYILLFIVSLFTGATCNHGMQTTGNKSTVNSKCFKAKLVIKGICMHYVIQVLEGNTAALNIEKEWKDESDGKVYKNVFALGSRCSFPDLKEGEEFYFTLAAMEDAGCNVCMAYRPVPGASNNIVAGKKPCS